ETLQAQNAARIWHVEARRALQDDVASPQVGDGAERSERGGVRGVERERFVANGNAAFQRQRAVVVHDGSRAGRAQPRGASDAESAGLDDERPGEWVVPIEDERAAGFLRSIPD